MSYAVEIVLVDEYLSGEAFLFVLEDYPFSKKSQSHIERSLTDFRLAWVWA